MASEGGVPIGCQLSGTSARLVGSFGLVWFGWLVGGVIVTADSPGAPNQGVSEQVLLFVSSFGGAVFGTCIRSALRSRWMGVVVFFFLVFYVQHFVLARFPLLLWLMCSGHCPPSWAAIGRWHIFYNLSWSRILNIIIIIALLVLVGHHLAQFGIYRHRKK